MPIIRKHFLTILVFILPIIILAPVMTGFPRITGSNFSDLEISHYPNALFLQRTISQLGQIPLWNPYILNGYPFDADPLSGLWYPPGWLSLLFPLPFGIILVELVHILAGGFGLYLYLQRRHFSNTANVTASALFMLMPNLIAHFGAGHVSLVYAICITPWVLYFSDLSISNNWKNLAICIGLTILADIRWLPYTILIWIIEETRIRIDSGTLFWKKGLFSVGLGILSASAIIVPLAIFTVQSTRATMTTADVVDYSLPPSRLMGFILPLVGGAEWTVYTGGIFFSLLLTALVITAKQKCHIPLWIGSLVFTIWSMAGSIPGASILADLPGINLTRVPARATIAATILSILILSQTFTYLERNWSEGIKKTIRLCLFGCFLISAASTGFLIASKSSWLQMLIAMVLVSLGLVWTFVTQGKGHQREIHLPGFSILIVLSFFVFDIGLLQAARPEKISVDPLEIGSAVSTAPMKVYSPSYSITQAQAMENGIRLINGVNPIQLQGYVRFLADASGVKTEGYSVIQPPIGDKDPLFANSSAKINFTKMAELGTDVIISAYPISSNHLAEVSQKDGKFIYKLLVGPKAPSLSTNRVTNIQIETIEWTPNSIVYKISSEQPGVLNTGENNYPGWAVYIDGKKGVIETMGHILSTVQLPSGVHYVEFQYIPIWTYIGLFISFVCFVFLLYQPRRGINENG